MSDVVEEIIQGLGTAGGGMVFALVVLVGAYFLFKKTFAAFLESNFNSQSFISKIEERQLQLESRISELERDIERSKEK